MCVTLPGTVTDGQADDVYVFHLTEVLPVRWILCAKDDFDLQIIAGEHFDA